MFKFCRQPVMANKNFRQHFLLGKYSFDIFIKGMRLNLTPVVKNLLIINIAIFISANFGLSLFLEKNFALYSFLSPNFKAFQLVSHIFLHFDIFHLMGNMLGLVFFAPILEKLWGTKRFLFFYFFCGIGAGLLHSGIDYIETKKINEASITYINHPSPTGLVIFLKQHAQGLYDNNTEFINKYADHPSDIMYINDSKSLVEFAYTSRLNVKALGASGAIFGILMAFAMLFPNTEIYLYFLFPLKAKYLVALYGAFELYQGFLQAPGDSVAHVAHLGGMLFAFILIKYWGTKRNKFY